MLDVEISAGQCVSNLYEDTLDLRAFVVGKT